MTRLTVAIRVLVALALVVGIGALPIRAINAALDPFAPYPGHDTDYGVARARAIRAAIPLIADKNEHAVIVLGSSGIARAFVPSVFDAAFVGSGRDLTSYDLGQLLLQPATSRAMARVVRETYEERHQHIALAFFGISVLELGRDSVRAAERAMPDQAFTFESAADLRARASTDPLGVMRDGLGLAVFGNIRPERSGLWLQDWAAGHPLDCNSGLKQPTEGPEAYAALVDYCDELRRQFPRGVPPWNPATRGGFDFGLPATRPMLERLIEHQPASITAPAPPPPLGIIDEDEIALLVAAARDIAAVSTRAFIVRDLLNPAVVDPRTPALRAVAERIARAADLPLLDPNDENIQAADFGDRTHLNPLAAERFTARLAARLKPIIVDSRASR